MLARGLVIELTHGCAVVAITSMLEARVHPFAGFGLRHVEGGAGRADARRWPPTSASRHSRQRHSPGEIDTAILSPGTGQSVVEQISMQRLGSPRGGARAISFLCSEQSSYVHGAELHINGGQHVFGLRWRPAFCGVPLLSPILHYSAPTKTSDRSRHMVPTVIQLRTSKATSRIRPPQTMWRSHLLVLSVLAQFGLAGSNKLHGWAFSMFPETPTQTPQVLRFLTGTIQSESVQMIARRSDQE